MIIIIIIIIILVRTRRGRCGGATPAALTPSYSLSTPATATGVCSSLDLLYFTWRLFYIISVLFFLINFSTWNFSLSRFEEAKLELLKIAKLTERYAVPILVLANKQDLPLARELPSLERELGVKDLGRNVGWTIKSCCGVTGEGLEEVSTCVSRKLGKK